MLPKILVVSQPDKSKSSYSVQNIIEIAYLSMLSKGVDNSSVDTI